MIKKIMIGLLVVMAIFITGCSTLDDHGDSEEGVSPETLSETINTYKIIDLRNSEDYEKGHINGSYNLPLEEISEANLQSLAISPDESLIIYANSDISPKRALTLLNVMGYENVKILKGGLVHWEEDGFQTVKGKSDFEVEIEEKESSLILISEEYEFGKVKKSNGEVSAKFTIQNTGSENVIIKEISTSCGCTSAEISSEEIQPQEEAVLTVIFDPNYHTEPEGEFTRTVFIQTSEGFELQAKIHVEIDEN